MLIIVYLFPIKTGHNLSSVIKDQPLIKQVPVLVYHHISKKSGKANLLFISEKNFAIQMKGLYDSGYHAILPNQLISAYRPGVALPAKPVMISFDDAHQEQFTLAVPILKQYGFKAVFFVMTVTLDKRGFLSSAQLSTLVQQGHITGAHTWDHPNLKHQLPAQWHRQLLPPKIKLESITGKPVDCFAYPYGAWQESLLPEINKAGFTTAFQLTGKKSSGYPLLTTRRMMVNGAWTPKTLISQMNEVFQ